MLRSVLAALLLTALLAMPALADAPRDERQERRQAAMERWQGLNETQRERGLERAEAHGLFARLTYDAGTGQASGAFLRLTVQPTVGGLQDVRVRANRTVALTPLLASVVPTPFALQDGPTVRGATLLLNGAGVDFAAHNDPTAALTWRASAATNLTFTLAPGLKAVVSDAHEVRITVGATHGHIVSNGAAPLKMLDDHTVVASLAAGDAAAVRLHPLHGGEALHDLIAALKAHRLGAFLRVADAGGVPAEDGEAGDVQATTRSIARGRVVWDIASEQHEGRVLFLTLDNTTLDLARLDQAVATLNGTGLTRVATTAAVVAAANGAFALVRSDDGQTVTLAVSVPHFSSYALALSQPVASETGSGTGGPSSSPATGGSSSPGPSNAVGTSGATRRTPGPEAAGAIAVLGLALLLRRRA
ncbi:MAG: hypothetical protein QOG31_486 [Thermoplasmata archaeon]|jgi:hypothetical protein|nr:hypothetical protein [Thermoplasmata archaeon]